MKLLALGADPHIHDQDGNSALLIAAARGHSDLVELFFKLNIANISDENKHGNNALIEAAMNGQIGTALVILKHGADFGAVNKAGLSSYQYCASVPGLLSQWVSAALFEMQIVSNKYFCTVDSMRGANCCNWSYRSLC